MSNPSSVLHRRPAYAVNWPALSCHQCYRFENVAESDSSDQSAKRRDDATRKLNTALADIQIRGRPAGSGGDIYVFALKGAGRSNAARDLVEERILNRLPDQLNAVDSQVTILAILPVIDPRRTGQWNGWRARVRVDLHSEFYSLTFILDRAAQRSRIDGQNDPARIPVEEAAAKQHAEHWYTEIWNAFFRLIDSSGAPVSFPFEKFFECRGLTLGISAPAGDPAVPAGNEHDPVIAPLRKRSEQRAARQTLLDWPNKHVAFTRYVLQFDRTGKHEQDANCVVCTALEERVLYASSMGEADFETGPAARVQPERYLLVHDGISRFQLGRLLRRFHVLDELRCAAIFDFSKLIHASERIRTLGNEIDNRLSTPEANKEKPSLNPQSLADIQGWLNDLSSGRQAPDPRERRAAGGLLYRINRSRYYARDFKQRMEDMLFANIDGWEPYNIFMHRNLYPILDHIDSIGTRFGALASRVERLTDARNLEELVKVESEIAYIQRIGEIIGWTAFAYYGGQILSKIIHPLCKSLPCISPSRCALLEHHEDALFFSMVIAIPVAIFLWLAFRNRWFAKLSSAVTGAGSPTARSRAGE